MPFSCAAIASSGMGPRAAVDKEYGFHRHLLRDDLEFASFSFEIGVAHAVNDRER